MRFAPVLAATAVWLIGACGGSVDKKTVFHTDLLVKASLPTAIDRFKSEFKRLPPMTLAEIAGYQGWAGLSIADNTTNECNECLLVGLRHPDLVARLDDAPGKTRLGNTDHDAWSSIPHGCPTGHAEEILDAWGSPVVYIRAPRYAQPVKIVNRDGKQVEVRALRRSDGTFYNRDSYQLISLGEDGVQSDDDRENFTRLDE